MEISTKRLHLYHIEKYRPTLSANENLKCFAELLDMESTPSSMLSAWAIRPIIAVWLILRRGKYNCRPVSGNVVVKNEVEET